MRKTLKQPASQNGGTDTNYFLGNFSIPPLEVNNCITQQWPSVYVCVCLEGGTVLSIALRYLDPARLKDSSSPAFQVMPIFFHIFQKEIQKLINKSSSFFWLNIKGRGHKVSKVMPSHSKDSVCSIAQGGMSGKKQRVEKGDDVRKRSAAVHPVQSAHRNH